MVYLLLESVPCLVQRTKYPIRDHPLLDGRIVRVQL